MYITHILWCLLPLHSLFLTFPLPFHVSIGNLLTMTIFNCKHLPANDITPFSFMADKHPIVYIYHISFIHSPAVHLACLYNLAIVILQLTSVCKCLCGVLIWSPFRVILRSDIVRSHSWFIFSFWDISILVSIESGLFYLPTSSVQDSLFPTVVVCIRMAPYLND